MIGHDGNMTDNAHAPLSGPADHELTSYVLSLIQLLAIRATASASRQLYRDLHIGSMDFRVMSVLAAEPGSSGSRVAEVIGRDEAAVSRSVVKLIKKGLVQDTPARGRARRMILSPAGEAVQHRAWNAARDRERRLLAVLPAADRERLRTMLQRLLEEMHVLDSVEP